MPCPGGRLRYSRRRVTVDGRFAASLSRLTLPFCFINTKAHSLVIGSQFPFTLKSSEWHTWLKALGYTTHILYLNPGSGSKTQLPSTGIATTLLRCPRRNIPPAACGASVVPDCRKVFNHCWVPVNHSPVLLTASDRRLAFLRSRTGIHRACPMWRPHPCDSSMKRSPAEQEQG
ncbi:uncharacterized protein An02g05030 [Aspergillus niger]|uniref:Contig An02c0150, genomic contig n=2 Tax=Aspergillus niger TaxID=5061 RepID=A2QCX1_ASPNC|nr:uncharacterized protein An02g05030 [Aspergillus niger]CAK37611.1 unnamed protein product [Aspergillus niger]